MGAPGGGLSTQLLPLRCPPRVVASRRSGFRRGQRPAIHRAHPAAVGASPSRCIPGIPSTTCTRRSRFRGGRPTTVNQPAARHGACKLVWEDTQWRSARSGTVGAAPVRAPLRECSSGFGRFQPPPLSPPLTYPPTDFLWAARQTGLAGHFPRSAKFICMGKQKNRLTATKRRNHFARIFGMRAHMSKPTTASRMVVTRLSCDACGRRESSFRARSRVGGWDSVVFGREPPTREQCT